MLIALYVGGFKVFAIGFYFAYIAVNYLDPVNPTFDWEIVIGGLIAACIVGALWPVWMFGLLIALYYYLKEKYHGKDKPGEGV